MCLLLCVSFDVSICRSVSFWLFLFSRLCVHIYLPSPLLRRPFTRVYLTGPSTSFASHISEGNYQITTTEISDGIATVSPRIALMASAIALTASAIINLLVATSVSERIKPSRSQPDIRPETTSFLTHVSWVKKRRGTLSLFSCCHRSCSLL